MSAEEKDWGKRWENLPHWLRSSQRLLSFVCLFAEVFVMLWIVSMVVPRGRLDTLEFGIPAVAIELAVAAFLLAVSIMIYAILIGELLWATRVGKAAGLLLSGAVIAWFIKTETRIGSWALMWWQIGVLALGGACATPLLLALFDINTKFLISRLYRGPTPLRYSVVRRWDSTPGS